VRIETHSRASFHDKSKMHVLDLRLIRKGRPHRREGTVESIVDKASGQGIDKFWLFADVRIQLPTYDFVHSGRPRSTSQY